MAELRLVPRLSELFDTFIWKHGELATFSGSFKFKIRTRAVVEAQCVSGERGLRFESC